jgi:hypothetical protein
LCQCGTDRITLAPVRSPSTVTIIPHSAGTRPERWDQSLRAAISQGSQRSHTDPRRTALDVLSAPA